MVVSFLIIANIAKKSNAKQLIELALAYSFRPIIVGMNIIVTDEDLISLNCSRMESLEQVKQYLISLESEHGTIPVIGIEIAEGAKSLSTYQFNSLSSCGNIALMPGNEGTGLNQKQRSVCDEYVYIPQYGDGIESLNVTVATSVVIFQYCQQLNLLGN